MNTLSNKTIVSILKKVVPKKSKLPILEAVQLNGDNIHATDLDLSVLIPFKSLGDICINARDFCENIDDPFILEKDFKIEYCTGVKLTGEDPENYPCVPRFVISNSIGSIGQEFLDKAQIASQYVSKDELRPAMMGLYISDELVSTDGHRLYHVKNPNPLSVPIVVPVKVFSILSTKGLEHEWTVSLLGNTVSITDSEGKKIREEEQNTHVLFTNNQGIVVYQSLIQEKYPYYQSVIPTDNQNRFTCHNEALQKMLKKAREYSDARYHQVKLSLNGSFEISTEDVEFGKEFRSTIEGANYMGEALEIGFNIDYLLSILENLDEEVTMLFSDNPHRGVTINDTFVLSPVRLNY